MSRHSILCFEVLILHKNIAVQYLYKDYSKGQIFDSHHDNLIVGTFSGKN